MRISDWSSDVCSSDLALDLRGAGGGAMHDEPQGGKIIAGPDLRGQFEQAHEHRRHHMHVRDPVLLNEGQRSEEHTSELQVTNAHLVCRLLLEKKKIHPKVFHDKYPLVHIHYPSLSIILI